ncbi:MAG: serine hydrolase domain-containing protein [Patescibacteria group bacterium]
MREKIARRAQKAIVEKVFPGCVIGIVEKNGKREVLPFGSLIYQTEKLDDSMIYHTAEPVRETTVYDIASITKSIPTASLISLFIEEGRLRLTGKVCTYLPELQNDRDATIEDLLLYRVHGVRLSELKDKTQQGILEHVFLEGFSAPSGKSEYTNLPALLLGIVAERVGGDTLDVFAQQYFFGPLKMAHTTFFPDAGNCAPTEIDGRGEVRGFPHDESAYVFAKAGRAVGHAGLFSTAPDILDFLETLLRGDYPYIVRGAEAGLGWQLHEPYFMGTHAGAHTFGKTGFTGTSVVVDIARGIGLVILSNRTYPQRPPDAISPDCAINIFRRDIADIVFG